MAKQLLGKEVTAALNEKIKNNVAKLQEKGIEPTLCIVRVGENPSDISYERGATKRCETLGVSCKKILLPENVSQEELLAVIDQLNNDEQVHGVLMFRPLPKHLDQTVIENALAAEKDVDCMTDLSMSGVFTNKEIGFPPCTPQACMEILDYYGIDCTGKKVVVVGRSLVVGKPAAMMLIKKNATVTVCHTKTVDMASVAREADILIVAAGRSEVIDASYAKEGQIVIDVGINVNAEGKLCGDVDYAAVEPVVEAITPVPGGVGSVTTSVLVGNVVKAAMKKANLN
jgi:methylenetetrahydrofolate dehydrogenase (NADP+)/methenyltetrahydrofolate cyclohydrolase